MEVVLQWLDDLDDAVFTVVLAWERLRRRCLQLGAASAAALAASAIIAADWVLPLATIAAFSVTVALLGAALAAVADAVTEARRGAKKVSDTIFRQTRLDASLPEQGV